MPLDRPLRILVSVHFELSLDVGAAGSTLRLADAWRRLGHEVELRSFDDLPARLRGRAGRVAYPWVMAGWLARRAHSFDVVDATTGDAWVHGTLGGSGRRPLLVTRSKGLEHVDHRSRAAWMAANGITPTLRGRLYFGGWRLWEVRRSLRAADLCLFLNRMERDVAVTELGVDNERTAVVRNGIADHFLGLPEPAPVTGPARVAVLGDLDQRKGADRAIATLNRFLLEQPDARVHFIGTRASADDVLATMDPELRSRAEVTPSYRNTDLPALLRDQHVLLFPGRSEGFGNVVQEAMACGLVPVVAEAAGPREIIESGVNGVAVNDPTPSGLAATLHDLFGDRGSLGRMRRAAHAAMQERSWDRVAAEQLDLIRAAIDRRGQ